MKHIIIGGDGFVGSRLAADLAAMGEDVLVADIHKSSHAHYAKGPFVQIDVTKAESVDTIPLSPEDVVYNLSAKMLSPIVTRAERHDFFWPVNFHGTQNILSWMEKRGADRLVHFTTDMIYGHSVTVPQDETHPAHPLGEYGESKLATERLAEEYRAKGFKIPIFRPRLIIGPGRLGILVKLFKLIDLNLPVPMIGSGRNLPIMDPEQYKIADEICILDTSKAKRELGWHPQYRDEDMLLAAYTEYRKGKDAHKQAQRSLAA
ncbi:NAD-dependent epimerase/dehydratase family protein [Bosea sp. TAB14]|uniref:NAD-dependent epimerase/dehydratase family protein n=1 Tax=Bosea sp. TAB14 TaxID=3237481 RepID=UPI003F92EA05